MQMIKNPSHAAQGCALLVVGLFFATPARAEFEIKESQIEKGEVELEYRGAVHWGFPSAERAEAVEDETGAEVEEEEGEFLRQSHDFEVAYGFAERWLVSATLGTDEPLDQDFDPSSVALELQYELIERKGNGLGLGFTGGYGFAARGGEADEIEFGPIVELATVKLLLTLNPFFNAQVGENRQTDGLASSMAGAPNMTSPIVGALASRCLARSRISPTPAHSTISRTASAQRCSTTPVKTITPKATMTITQARPRWNCL
jgi:hypothetical protein